MTETQMVIISPEIQLSDKICTVLRFEDPKEMNEEGSPDSELELMQQIDNQHPEEIEAKGGQRIRKSILSFQCQQQF